MSRAKYRQSKMATPLLTRSERAAGRNKRSALRRSSFGNVGFRSGMAMRYAYCAPTVLTPNARPHFVNPEIPASINDPMTHPAILWK
jgi:hypothetical protein